MNILLLYPLFPDTFWSLRHAIGFADRKALLPPLGLLTVAAMLPRDWNLRLIDLNVQPLEDADLRWADYAFLSAMVVQLPSTQETIARCQAAGVPVVAGGPLFTCQPQLFDHVEHLILNEAELTLPPFLRDLERGTPQRIYRTDELADVTQSPLPRWDLLDLRQYMSMSVQYSRGCPFDCDFCNVTALLGRRPRTKTAPQILAEVDSLRQAGWRQQVFFVDDNFIGNQRALKREILPALIQWRGDRRDMPMLTQTSMNIADDEELVRLMVQAGFDTIFVGIETPDLAGLQECHKTANTRRDLVADVQRLQRTGLQVYAGFIIGFDSDTPDTFQHQIDFIDRSGIVTAMVGLLQAFPGTRLYQRLAAQDRLRGLATGDNTDGTTNVIPKMDLSLLLAGHRRILRTIYSPGAYYRRVRNLLRISPRPLASPPLDSRRLLAFVRSLYHLGIRGRERFHYWWLLASTLLRRPRKLPLAVNLALCGYHYRQIYHLDSPERAADGQGVAQASAPAVGARVPACGSY